MAEDNNKNKNGIDNDKIEYIGMGANADAAKAWFDNFWYHHKWKVIITAFFVIVFGICTYQIATREVPDVYIMYAGPEYMSAGDVIGFKSAMREVMEDYNEDGEKGMTLITLTCVSEEKLEKLKAEAEAASEDFYIDMAANSQNNKQFGMEIFAGEAVICLLDPSLYESVHEEGGFVKLSTIFSEEELSGLELYDESGVYLHSLNFGKYYSAMKDLPEDTVLCIRKVSTISVFKGKKKYEKLHEQHVDMFRSIVLFRYPEGYVPETEAAE